MAGLAKIPCGVCAMCQTGYPAACRHMDLMGVTLPGCFSELVLLPERGLIKIEDRISDSEGACLQPVGDCATIVSTAGIAMGDTIAVFGQGCMGMNILQIARASGAGILIGVDIRDDVLRKSKDLGAAYVVNAKETDPVSAIRELTDGRGADIVFEAAGGNPEKGLCRNKDARPGYRFGERRGQDNCCLLLWTDSRDADGRRANERRTVHLSEDAHGRSFAAYDAACCFRADPAQAPRDASPVGHRSGSSSIRDHGE